MGSDSETEKSLKERKKVISLMPIAKPLAGKKLCKRTLKLVRRGNLFVFMYDFLVFNVKDAFLSFLRFKRWRFLGMSNSCAVSVQKLYFVVT